jgi:O-antigen/teichoic acid export membrane protein
MSRTALADAIRSVRATSSDVGRFGLLGGLRLAAGVLQFSIVLYIAGYLSLEDLGEYSVFVIVLGYFSQLAGFSFSTFLIRELGAYSRDTWPVLFMQQLRFLSASYLMALAIAMFVIALGLGPDANVGVFGALLFLALLNSAFENYLVGAGYPLPAALNVLLRAGWILPLACGSLLGWVEPRLESVLLIWTAGESIAAAAVLLQIRRKDLLPMTFYPTDRAWIARGCRVGLRHTTLAILLLVTMSIQRVVLGRFHPEDQVGIFHFYFVIAVFIPNLLEASLYALILPRLIKEHQHEDGSRLRFPDPKLFLFLIGAGGAGLLVVAGLLPQFLPLLGKAELLGYRYLLFFTAPYALMYTSARVFHYQLYASHRDGALVRACGVACAVACAASFILIPRYGLDGAAASLVASGTALVVALATPFVVSQVA